MVASALGSTKPQPVLPACSEAASAEQMPTAVAPISAQQALEQSASLTQPPVINCEASPAPTFFAPALLGVRARVAVATRLWVLGACAAPFECLMQDYEWKLLTSQDGSNGELHIEGLQCWSGRDWIT